MKMIKLTRTTNRPVWVMACNILFVNKDDQGAVVTLIERSSRTKVKESPEEIAAMINGEGDGVL